MNNLEHELLEGLNTLPVVDVHTHLTMGGCRQAQTLADIVSYHWLQLELVRAGAQPMLPQDIRNDPNGCMTRVVPYFKDIRNTSNHYCFTGMLRDLYGFKERYLTADNWQAVDQAVRAHAADKSWVTSVMDKAKLDKLIVTSQEGTTYTGAGFVPYEYMENMLVAPTSRRVVSGQLRWPYDPLPATAAELRDAIGKRVENMRKDRGVRALHGWIHGAWSYQLCDEKEADELLQRMLKSETLTQNEEDRQISATADILAEAAAKAGITLQFFHGMMTYPLKDRTIVSSSYWNPEFIRSLIVFARAHPQTMIDVFLGSRIPSHEAASLSRNAKNVVISGGWWHGFTPSTLTTFFRDRLELLPNTAWNAFYSDAYMIEWVYAKLLLTRNCLARALAGMVDEGFLAKDDALPIARQLLHDNAFSIYQL